MISFISSSIIPTKSPSDNTKSHLGFVHTLFTVPVTLFNYVHTLFTVPVTQSVAPDQSNVEFYVLYQGGDGDSFVMSMNHSSLIFGQFHRRISIYPICNPAIVSGITAFHH